MPAIVLWIGLAVAALVMGAFASLVIRNALAARPTDLGLVDGRLRPCPASPNCVCSQDADAMHAIEPLTYSGTAAEAIERLKAAILRMPRTKIVADTGDYLHVEFTTRLMRYVDDVEFAVDHQQKVIHCRSASRIGYSDLGVNRQRIEAIRETYSSQ